jgi:hypothetical protein
MNMPDKPQLDPDDLHRKAEGHQEWLLDESLGETFPASDPISPAEARVPRARPVNQKIPPGR